MIRRVLCLFAMLVGIGTLSGCGTTGGGLRPTSPSFDSSKPHAFLSDANVEQAKSVAMGSAVSKGWKIVDASDSRLLVGRQLDAAAAQSVTDGPVATASIEVETEFHSQAGGTEVVVGAALITDKGAETEKRIDFTDNYAKELNHSLSSLLRSWEENRWRVASATPPLPPKNATPATESTQDMTPAVQAWQSAVEETQAAPAQSVAAPQPEAPASAPPPVMTSSTDDGPAPIEDHYIPKTLLPTRSSTQAASPEGNMLTLNRTTAPGVWAYYAEHYAKIRGCEISDKGAILEDIQPEYEIHHVYCDNGRDFVVKCNAGTCRGM